MNFSLKRMQAILIKDYKEFSRNYAVSIVVLFPPILAAFYSRIGVESLDAYYLVFNMTFAMIATYVQSCLIAEEREKDTLRGLLLSPASRADIIVGKSSLTFLVTSLILAITMFFGDYKPKNLLIIILAFFISILFYISLGTLIGLFAKSVMEASVYSLPVIGVFSFGSFITTMSEQYPALKILHYLPNIQLMEIANGVEAGNSLMTTVPALLIIGGWVIIVSLFTAYIYKKRMVD